MGWTGCSLSNCGWSVRLIVFHPVGFDDGGKLVLRIKIKRLAPVSILEKLPKCIIGMDACLSAHIVSKNLCKMGFKTPIISAKYTKPFQ